MRTRLKWVDQNYGASEIRVYHGTATLDTQNLPAPLAVLGPKVTEYYHENIDTAFNHHYIVAALVNGAEYFSPEVMVEPGQNPIADLFALGKKGFWYDPSDLSAQFQDTAGTIAVTADGDPVRKVIDKSGNGHNLTNGTGWVYRTNGTHSWWELNQSYMTAPGSTASMAFAHQGGTGGGYTLCAGVRFGTVANPNNIYVLVSNGGASSSRIGINLWYDDRSDQSRSDALFQLVGNGSPGGQAVSATTGSGSFTPNVDHRITEVVDPDAATSARHLFRLDAGSDITANTATSSPSTSNASDDLHIGAASNNLVGKMTGRIYQLVLVQGQLDATQRGTLEAAVSAKIP